MGCLTHALTPNPSPVEDRRGEGRRRDWMQDGTNKPAVRPASSLTRIKAAKALERPAEAMQRQKQGSRNNVPAARDLRVRETSAEALLWDALRGRRLDGLKFRRQHPVGPFVLDLCCPDCRLAIELDGGVHEGQGDRDADRDAMLTAAGYRVLRFPNEAVHNHLAEVLDSIRTAASQGSLWRPPHPGRRSGLR